MTQDDVKLEGLASETNFIDRVLATTPAIVLLMDCEGRITFFNDYMRDLSGYELDEVRGKDWFEVFVPEQLRAPLRDLYATALDEVQVEANVNPVVTKTGEVRQIEWWGNTLQDDEGEVLGLVSIGQDITDRLALQTKLAETERLATVGMMASVFAHEVGNPLNAMFLQAQLLRRRIDKANRGPLTPKVDMILSEIKRLNMLLEDFRAFHQPGSLILELTNLSTVLTQVAEILAERAAERDIEMHCEVPAELPYISGNANKLKQVFINLCKNGFEAMSGGGKLEIRALADDTRVRVDITDHGRGIPEDIDPFAPFVTTKPSGMGLGLPLVHEIVAAHDGELAYTSEPGKGTTFTVSLPRRPANESD